MLGTSSSESALPSLMEKMESAGCQGSVVGLVVPTGYSFNLDGTNIYMTLAALFIAQATNIAPVPRPTRSCCCSSRCSAPRAPPASPAPASSRLPPRSRWCPSVPVAGMALILGIDRFMSECRALTNFIGNAVATIVVARWEGELDEDRLATVLGSLGESLSTAGQVVPAE